MISIQTSLLLIILSSPNDCIFYNPFLPLAYGFGFPLVRKTFNPSNHELYGGMLSGVLRGRVQREMGFVLHGHNKDDDDDGEDKEVFEEDCQDGSEEMDEDDEALMAAFDGLDQLVGSLDDDGDNLALDVKGFEDISLDDLDSDLSSSGGESGDGSGGKVKKSAEEEIKMYTDMLGELSDKGEEGIYDDLRLDLTASGFQDLQSLLDSNEEDDDNDEAERIPNPTQDVEIVKEGSNQAMIDKVMKEALEEAKAKSPDIPISDIDADAEMMSEINALFDKAAVEMKDAAAQIKKDQDYLSEEYSKLRAQKVKEDEERVRQGEAQVQKMMKKVDKEANEVQIAIKELEEARSKVEELNKDPLMKVLNFKEAGIVRQGAFALMLLCGVRSVGDLTQIGGVAGNEHAFLAGIQALIAVVAGATYFFL